MEISRSMQAELQKRDETLLAMEMLIVDQACRLLALESILLQLPGAKAVSREAVKDRIRREAARFQDHFEGTGMSGFIERAQRIAETMVADRSGVEA